MNNNFVNQVKILRDEDLLRMTDESISDDYETEAIEAAREELKRRNISSENSERIRQEIKENQHYESDRLSVPLSKVGWVIFVLFGHIFIISIPVVLTLSARGYNRKAKDAIQAIFLGFVLYGLVVVVVGFGWL